jgi:hypothetical protein
VRFGIVPDVAEAHLPKMTSLRRHHQKTTCETVANPVRPVLAYRLPTHNGRPVRDHPPTGFGFLLKCQRRWFSLLLCDTPKFNAACFSLGHQPCSQGSADDEAEHRIKYNEPDRRNYDGRLMRFRGYLCLHILSSAEPELIKNAQDRERQSAKHKDNSFKAVVSNDRCVVYDFRITTKQLITPRVDENAGAQGKKQRNGESDAQRGLASGLDGEKKSEHIHVDVTRWRKARLRTGRGVSWLAFIVGSCDTSISRLWRTTFQKV